MHRIGATFFLILYLFSTTESYQVLKFPVIVQHFREHKKIDKNIGFFQFLDMHYLHGSPRDSDYERDMQLPFKRSNHHFTQAPVHIKDLATTTVAPVFFGKSTQYVILDDNSKISLHPSSIFQPPRA